MFQAPDLTYIRYGRCSLFDQKPLIVTCFIQPMRGKYRSWLVRCEDGELYVLKLNGSVWNRNLLANEAIGWYLLDSLGIPVPHCRQLIVTPWLLNHPGMKATLDEIRPTEGTHFGSAFMGGTGMMTYDYLPLGFAHYDEHTTLGVYLFDLWCNNLDDRQAVHLRCAHPAETRVLFIDNSEICGGPTWSFTISRSGNAFTNWDLRPNLETIAVDRWCHRFRTHIPSLLKNVFEALPASWYTGDLAALRHTLLLRLGKMDELLLLERLRRKLIGPVT